MDSIPGALSSIKDRGLRMRLMLLSLTLGLSPDDKVICRGIEVLENTQDAVSAHIDTNRISFVISIRSTLNGRRTFIRIGRSENDGYQRNLIEKIISTARASGELPPVAENISSAILRSYEEKGGMLTPSSDGSDAIILPLGTD